MLVALNATLFEQASDTAVTSKAIYYFLDYAATKLNAKIRYHASGMHLHINSNASYLAVCQACSCAGDHFILSNTTTNTSKPSDHPTLNGTSTLNTARYIM